MKPESEVELGRAREELDNARKIFAIGLAKPTARAAYYVAFHAAQALIFEDRGRNANTFRRPCGIREDLPRARHHLDQDIVPFLGRAYGYKELADYGNDSELPIDPPPLRMS